MKDWQFDPQAMLPGGGDTYPARAAEFLETAYRASLYLEEGQQLNFACALLASDEGVPLRVRLAVREEATVQRLRKIGVALDPRHNVLVVQAGDPHELVGICGRTLASTLYPRVVPTPPMFVSVRGLGQLAVAHGDSTVMFSRDRYVRRATGEEVLGVVWPHVAEAIAKDIKPDTRQFLEKFKKADPTFDESYHLTEDPGSFVRRRCATSLLALAQAIQSLGCGGGALLVPDYKADPAKVVDKWFAMDAEYSGGPAETWAGCIHALMALAPIVPREIPHPVRPDDPWVKEWSAAHRFANEEIEQTARLARADGAVVLDWVFTPLGFGAKFKTGQPDELPGQVQRFLRDREKGMRHRSMAAAVHAVPGAAGLVVSEDGDCTLFGNRGGTTALDLVL